MTPPEPRPDPGVPDPETTGAYLPRLASSPAPTSYDFLDPPTGPDELGWLAHYRVIRLIGEGGMGLVFRAEDSQLLRPVALKVIRPELANAPAAALRFLREARAAAAINHDHVVTVYQVGQHRDVAYLAMEHLQGLSLQKWLERGRKPSVDLVLRIGREVASGLAAAHKLGLIHRDIKPANLWLEAPSGRIKILDFGQARALLDDVQITHAGAINGTPAFMAPEQARGEPADASSDLFSLGCVLYRLWTGELPFPGPTILAVLTSLAVDTPKHLREIDPALPPALSDLVMQLLSKAREGRPPSAQAVVEAIRGIERQLASDRQEAELGSIISRSIVDVPAPPSSRTGPRWRRAAVAVVGLTAIGLAWAGFSAASRPRKPEVVPAGPSARVLVDPEGPPAPVAVEPAPTSAPTEVAGPPKPADPPPPVPPSVPDPPRSAADVATRERSEPRSPAPSAWGPFIDPDGDCKASVDEEHNRVTIGVPAKAHLLSADLGRLNAPRLLRDVRGDFEARVRVSGTDHPSVRASTKEYDPYHGAGLLLWQDSQNYIRLEIATAIPKGKPPLRYANFELRQGGKLASSKGLKLDDRASLLRLERRGGQVRASFGWDGVNWTSFDPLEAEFPERLEVGLVAINSAMKLLQATLEDFAVTPLSDLPKGVPAPPIPGP
jgi:serine/threonine protein kinase/regulation of enolase protein 1 (concanavalin A-like superfamily)